jgi:CPA2 family monovalent cation:H+ antiporter-2
VAITQPFMPGGRGALLLALVLATLGVIFWRRTADLHGHVRAGAQLVIEVLAAQSQLPRAAIAQVHEVLPGIGEPVAVRLEPGHAAIGRTLAELDLRGMTGATVLAITRDGASVTIPTAQEALRDGDLLALAGTSEAIDAARAVLARRVAGASA